MIPNLSIPSFSFFGIFEINTFAFLVVIAVITGCELSYQRAKRINLNKRILVDGILWGLLAGFVVSHWVFVIFYYPERVLKNPFELLMFWKGISAFGGFFGAILGALLYFRKKKVAAMPCIESMLFGFVPAWIVGRLGCTIAFDHPGVPTDFFLGMADEAGVVRHNLGFYEMLLAIALAIILYATKNTRPFDGFHCVLIIFLYAPFRLFCDSLRVADITYFGFTPGQYFSLALYGLGIFLIIKNLGVGSSYQVSG